jgi:hypothetical protein
MTMTMTIFTGGIAENIEGARLNQDIASPLRDPRPGKAVDKVAGGQVQTAAIYAH